MRIDEHWSAARWGPWTWRNENGLRRTEFNFRWFFQLFRSGK